MPIGRLGRQEWICRKLKVFLGECKVRIAARPESTQIYISGLARKYMRDDLEF